MKKITITKPREPKTADVKELRSLVMALRRSLNEIEAHLQSLEDKKQDK